MAAITKSSTHLDGNVYNFGFGDGFMPPDIKTVSGFRLGMFYAAEPLGPGDAVQINGDGQLIRAVGDSAAHARIHGFVANGAASGALVPLYDSIIMVYAAASGLTPGANVYLSASTQGGLDTASSANVPSPCGFCLDDKRVYLKAI